MSTAAPTPPAALVVLGSANRDFTVVVDRHPHPGETVLGGHLVTGSGGKGANQAVAAARAGAAPVLVAAVGNDAAGTELLADLESAGVDVSLVERTHTQPTGVALITVAASGENSIVVAPGANTVMHPSTISESVSAIVGPGSVLLVQLEIPLPVVVACAHTATVHGARLVLNLSPSQGVPDSLLALADPLLVNASEASAVSGTVITSIDEAKTVATKLLRRSLSVVITLGGDGVVAADETGVREFPSRSVPVVDTTGAGDAFAGALAASLAAGGSLWGAVEAGILAGSLAVQHRGAQPPAGFAGV